MKIMFLALLLLTSCGTVSGDIKPAETPKPLASDPAICSYTQDEPSVKGSIPVAKSEEEREGLENFLLYVRGLIDFGREADRIADLAAQECLKND